MGLPSTSQLCSALMCTVGSGLPGPDASPSGLLFTFGSRTLCLLCRWRGRLWKPDRQVTPILWSHIFASFPFVVSIHRGVFFSPAITHKLILPFVSVTTVPLSPINTGTWQQFLETRTVVADTRRIMPTMRCYFQEMTTIIAYVSRLNTGPDTPGFQTQFLASANLSIRSQIK